jgi:hypothetical protein
MPHFISWPLHWMWDHPYQTGFYLLAIVVSIYGNVIKTFLSIPPQKLNTWLLRTRLVRTERRLDMLILAKNMGLLYIIIFALKYLATALGVLLVASLVIIGLLTKQLAFTGVPSFTYYAAVATVSWGFAHIFTIYGILRDVADKDSEKRLIPQIQAIRKRIGWPPLDDEFLN